MLLQQVSQAIQRQRLLSPGDRGAVAFSGGADSLCLLHLLSRFGPQHSRAGQPLRLVALVVDHGLRRASAEEAARALSLARGLGLEAELLQARVPRQGNLQERAREARLELLRQAAEARGCDWVALGHTASDQAETVLMRAVRGAGLQGLAGMDWRQGRFIRPLLDVTREQVLRYLRRHGLEPVEDPTNDSDDYLRNRLRHRLLPLLERENPRVVTALCRLAHGCREDHQALTALARSLLQQASADGGLELAPLAAAPPAIRHRALRLAYADAVGGTRRLTRDHVLALDGLLAQQQGSAAVDLPAARAVRVYGRLRFDLQPAEPSPLAEVPLQGPGEVTLSDGRRLLIRRQRQLSRPAAPDSNPREHLLLDPGALQAPLMVRGHRPGDRIAVGPDQSRKVARVLLDAKIPRALRGQVPLLLSGPRVLLVVGVRRAYGCAPKNMDNVISVQIDTPGGASPAQD